MSRNRTMLEMLTGVDLEPDEEAVLFPPQGFGDVVAVELFGMSPRTVATVDISTPAGMAVAQFGFDPVIESYLSRIGHHDR